MENLAAPLGLYTVSFLLLSDSITLHPLALRIQQSACTVPVTYLSSILAHIYD